MTAGRRIAIEALAGARRGRRLDLAFRAAVRSEEHRGGVDRRDRRFARELAYGTVRLRGRLDHLLDHHLDRGVDGVEPALLDVLRVGAYQLLYMDGVPAYAAVSESVDAARTVSGRGAAGLANAVLRALRSGGDDPALFPDFHADPAGWLTTRGSHPRWLVERWLERWSPDEVRALVEANNRIPPLTFVPIHDSPESAAERLGEAGIEAAPVGGGTGAVEVRTGRDPAAVLDLVPGIVQDPGATLVVRYADFPAGARLLDLCAAPGGKGLLAAAGGCRVVAADRSPRRLALVRENVERTGLRAPVVAALAEHPPFRPAAAVLLDVPCTGTGTLRRHPDARWRLGPEDVASLAAVQARILRRAASVVSSGGLLVYSTCTLEPEENEAQVEAFLARHPDFVREAPGEGAVEPAFLDGEGDLRVLPWRTGFDGAFAARLRRRAGG